MKWKTALLFISIHLFSPTGTAWAQEAENDSLTSVPDSIKDERGELVLADTSIYAGPLGKSPVKASLYSAMLPGLGQLYNAYGSGKWWIWAKIPVILGTMGYMMYNGLYHHNVYIKSKEAYFAKTKPELGLTDYYPSYPAESVRGQLISFRETRDLNFVLFALVYVLNIVDASVDAHMSEFDISRRLGLKISPRPLPYMTMISPGYGYGLGLTFQIQKPNEEFLRAF